MARHFPREAITVAARISLRRDLILISPFELYCLMIEQMRRIDIAYRGVL